MVPIFLESAPVVSHEVLAEEKAIIKTEGWFHVAGRYYASAPDADKMRRLEAERRCREAVRLASICAWCDRPIVDGDPTEKIALRNVHRSPCAAEFDRWTAGDRGDNDPRWARVTDMTPVEFNGEMCTWGSLSMLADRKAVEMTDDGRLVGGYQF